MSATGFFKSAGELLAGRWQVPVALAAAVVGSLALMRLLPAHRPVEFDSFLADVRALADAGDTVAAADAAANLLELDPTLTPERQAALHDELAELIYRSESGAAAHSTHNLTGLVKHQNAASALGLEATPRATVRLGFAQLWLGQSAEALATLKALLQGDVPTESRREAMRGLIELLRGFPDARPAMRELLPELLSDETLPTAYAWWALRQLVQEAIDKGDVPEAHQVLSQYGDRLTTSDVRGYREYLQACVALREGRPEEAEPLALWVENWAETEGHASESLDELAHLPTLNRCLLGRIHLAENQPADALADFERALLWRPVADVRLEATTGRGSALAALGRHAEARQSLQAALDELVAIQEQWRAAAERYRALLVSLYEQYRDAVPRDAALAYLALAAELTPAEQPDKQADIYERLGDAYGAAAALADGPDVRRQLHEQAGRSLERAAGLVHTDEPRLATLLWSAGEQYDQAGLLADTRRALSQFVAGREGDRRLPRALLQLGQAHEGGSELEAALAWYTRLTADYPRLEEAARARVLSARVLSSLGRNSEAEQVLVGLLTDDNVDPDARVYRESLLALCELLYQQGRYGEAIGRLEDFRALYPDDGERIRVLFMLANAQRRSGLELRTPAPDGIGTEARLTEGNSRLRAAAEMYGTLLSELEGVAATDGALGLYARLAQFYRADCLFDLNDRESLQDALAAYRSAAVRYEGQPAALTAYVQMANIYLRHGELAEAARSLERARWLLQTVPAEAFDSTSGCDRAAWERFLDVALSSDLLRDALAVAR